MMTKTHSCWLPVLLDKCFDSVEMHKAGWWSRIPTRSQYTLILYSSNIHAGRYGTDQTDNCGKKLVPCLFHICIYRNCSSYELTCIIQKLKHYIMSKWHLNDIKAEQLCREEGGLFQSEIVKWLSYCTVISSMCNIITLYRIMDAVLQCKLHCAASLEVLYTIAKPISRPPLCLLTMPTGCSIQPVPNRNQINTRFKIGTRFQVGHQFS